MKPQLMTLGSPRPRKDSADSMRIAVATVSEPVTMIGDRQLGRTWRKMTRRSLMPRPMHACTNSRWRMARNSPRTSRATPGQLTTAMAMTMLRIEVDLILDTLSARERRVLQLRFGLSEGRERTLEEVGKRLNVTRERIRQIEAKALRKLRDPSRSKKLRDYLNSS